MTRESAIVDAIVAELRKRHAYVINFHGATRVGVPDLIACLCVGRYVAIEVKAPGKSVSIRQRKEIERIRRAHGIAFEADSADKVREVLDAVQAGRDWKAIADAA